MSPQSIWRKSEDSIFGLADGVGISWGQNNKVTQNGSFNFCRAELHYPHDTE